MPELLGGYLEAVMAPDDPAGGPGALLEQLPASPGPRPG